VGLFDTGSVAYGSAGYISAKVTAKANKLATGSGKLQVDGNKVAFKAVTFDLFGVSGAGLADRSKLSKTNLTVRLVLPLDGENTLTGTVSNNDGSWVATIDAYKEDEVPDYAGLYTLAVPGVATNYVSEPGGYGYNLVSIDTNGVISMKGGKLADGQVWSQKTRVSAAGRWPLYSWMNSAGGGQYNSVILGWLTVSSNGISGTANWIKPVTWGTRYAAPFALQPEVLGSPYNTNAAMVQVGWSGVASWIEGGLLAEIDRPAVFTNGNKYAFGNVSNMPSLKVVPASGKLTFGIRPVEFNFQSTPGGGVILMNVTNGVGYFTPMSGVNTNYTGAFELR
jgi:hypothetical protein